MDQLNDLIKKRFKTERLAKRICNMNTIASDETADFQKLTAYSQAHTIIFADVFEAYKEQPDSRFGDTLLMFCDGVKHGRIKITPKFYAEFVDSLGIDF